MGIHPGDAYSNAQKRSSRDPWSPRKPDPRHHHDGLRGRGCRGCPYLLCRRPSATEKDCALGADELDRSACCLDLLLAVGMWTWITSR
jgi:hypothetical protein